MSDWRERWEEKDIHGNIVHVVWEPDGHPLAYTWSNRIAKGCSNIPTYLIPKKKPPTYRPYKRGEVKCGDVFVGVNGTEAAVTAVGDGCVFLGHSTSSYSLHHLLLHWKKLDGTPAGVAE